MKAQIYVNLPTSGCQRIVAVRDIATEARDENEEMKKQLKKCVNWRGRRSRASGGRVWEEASPSPAIGASAI